MRNKEDEKGSAFSGKSPLSAMLEKITSASNAVKKTNTESGSDSDTDMDPDINISLKTTGKLEEEVQEDDPPHISIAEAMRVTNEAFEKEITDAARIKQQKEAVEEDESRFADLVDGLYDTSGSSDPNGPELP